MPRVFKVFVILSCFFAGLTVAEEKLQDPTKPYRFAPPAPVSFTPVSRVRVNYIKQSEEGNVAFINGKAVKEGGTIDGMRVAEIYKNSVRLIRNGKAVLIALHSSDGITKKKSSPN